MINKKTSPYTALTQQLHHPPASPFLVINLDSGKTLGAVYAASIQSASDIANTLWIKDKDALYLFDLRKEFDGVQSRMNTDLAPVIRLISETRICQWDQTRLVLNVSYPLSPPLASCSIRLSNFF